MQNLLANHENFDCVFLVEKSYYYLITSFHLNLFIIFFNSRFTPIKNITYNKLNLDLEDSDFEEL
jgi:hypothetical protein